MTTYFTLPELRTAGFGPSCSFRLALRLLESPVDCVAASDDSNAAGMRGEKEERIDELRLSRSLAARLPAEEGLREELPFKTWAGMADGFGPGGGDPEPMIHKRSERTRMRSDKTESRNISSGINGHNSQMSNHTHNSINDHKPADEDRVR